jgi:hypothetical protein
MTKKAKKLAVIVAPKTKKSYSNIIGALTTIISDLKGYEAEKRQEISDNDQFVIQIQEQTNIARDEAEKSQKTLANIEAILG